MPIKRVLLHNCASAFWHWWLGVTLSLQLVYVWHLGDVSLAYPQSANPAVGSLAKVIEGIGNFNGRLLASENDSGAVPIFALLALLILVTLLALPAILHKILLGVLFSRIRIPDFDTTGKLDSITISRQFNPLEEEGDNLEEQVQCGLVRRAKPGIPTFWSFTSGKVLAVDGEHNNSSHGVNGNINRTADRSRHREYLSL